MDIYILNKNAQKLKEVLSKDKPGYNIKVYTDVEAFYKYVTKTAVMADMFIITDNGIASDETELSTGFTLLSQLFEYEYFKPKTTVFLNKVSNKEHLSKYEFLKRKLADRGEEIEIITKKFIEVSDLDALISRSTITYQPLATNAKSVVQVRRGSRTLSTKVIPAYSGDETIAIALNTVDTIGSIVKDNHRNNTARLVTEDESDNVIDEMPEDFDIDFEEETTEYKHVKYITVTGNGGAGVSTTALTFALNAAMNGKTLLIDADANLGLSYLVEELIPESDRFNINLEELIKGKDAEIDKVIETNHKSNLHVLSATLPVIREDDITESTIEYMILNILSLLEQNYQYIIIDMPFRIMPRLSTLLSRSDLIVSSCAPYLNKVVPMLNSIKSSEILRSTKAYKDGLFMTYLIGICDFNKTRVVSIQDIKDYSKEILGKEILCTNPFVCTDGQFIAQDRFRAIINKADVMFNRKEEE